MSRTTDHRTVRPEDAFDVRAGPELVEGWAWQRLPFEPKASMLDYRKALRGALGRLSPSRVLYCTYTSTDSSRCDIENVLLYNVGLSAFSHLGVTDVVAERIFAPPPPRLDGGTVGNHHHHYALGSTAILGGCERLATWPLTHVAPPWTVERLWSALRRSVQPHGPADPASARLSLEVALVYPPSSRSPTGLSAMKAVIDAMIASIHAHDGSDADLIASRMATRLPRSEVDIAAELLDDSRAVLGRRRLLWPYTRFVHWNPADDCLDFIRVTARRGETWGVGGWLQVKPSSAARKSQQSIAR